MNKKNLSNTFIGVILSGLILELIFLFIFMIISVQYQNSRNFCRKIKSTCQKDCQNNTGSSETTSTEMNKTGFCYTKECLDSAKTLLDSMNMKANPCEDFYEFSCGGWIEKNPVKKYEYTSTLLKMRPKAYALIKEYLELSVNKNSPEHLKMLKKQYIICKKYLGTDLDMGPVFFKNSSQSLGGWPLIIGKRWDETNFSITDTLISITKLGLGRSHLFLTEVIPNSIKSDRNIISIKKPTSIVYDIESYSKDTMKEIEEDFFNETFKLIKALNFTQSMENKKEELREILKFEVSLFKILNETSYIDISVENLENMSSQINWTKYFREVVNPSIDEEETIEVFDIKFLENLSALINETEPRTIANYLLLKVAYESISAMYGDADTCLNKLSSFLSIALTSAFVKANSYTVNKRNWATIIPIYVQIHAKKSMHNVTWMTPPVREKAVKKLDYTFSNFPFAEEFFNDTILDIYYENLTYGNVSYFINLINMRKWKLNLEFSMLKEENWQKDWKFHVTFDVFQTYHELYFNSVDLGIQLLQDPIFNVDRPWYLNFGAIGSIIAHEFIHGVIYPGYKYDNLGIYEPWWDEDTESFFKSLIVCLIEMYDNFTIPGTSEHIDGQHTVLENFADISGIKMAYDGYWEIKEYLELVELKLPGLHYTPGQLFWLSLGHIMCSNYDLEYLKEFLKDKHSPTMFRLQGMVINNEEFSKDFNCPVGSTMNPQEKCETFWPIIL